MPYTNSTKFVTANELRHRVDETAIETALQKIRGVTDYLNRAPSSSTCSEQSNTLGFKKPRDGRQLNTHLRCNDLQKGWSWIYGISCIKIPYLIFLNVHF